MGALIRFPISGLARYNQTYEGTVRVRANKFFEIGVVGRRTGITLKPNVKKDADGMDNIDDFWDDGNDRSSIAPGTLKDQSSSYDDDRSRYQAYKLGQRPRRVDTPEIEISRRQRSQKVDEHIGQEFMEEFLDIPEELLATPTSHRSRAILGSTSSHSDHSFGAEYSGTQGDHALSRNAGQHDPSADDYPSPSFQDIRRRIDFSRDIADPELEMTTPKTNIGNIFRSNGSNQALQTELTHTFTASNLSTTTIFTSSIPRLRISRPQLSTVETLSTGMIGMDQKFTPLRYKGPSRAFDLSGFDDSGSHSGPDDVLSGEEVVEGDYDISLETPETPSRPSHSILVSATPEKFKRHMSSNNPLVSSKSKVVSNSVAIPREEQIALEDEHQELVSSTAKVYQFSDEEPEPMQEHDQADTDSNGLGAEESEAREPTLALADSERSHGDVRSKRAASAVNASHTSSRLMQAMQNIPITATATKQHSVRPRRQAATAVSTVRKTNPALDPVESQGSHRQSNAKRSLVKNTIHVMTRSSTRSVPALPRKDYVQETLTVVPVVHKNNDSEQDASGVRRSKRCTFKPLEYWRNERVLMGRSDHTPQPLPVVKAIVRAPPLADEHKKGKGTKRKRGNAVQSSRTKSHNAKKVMTRSSRDRIHSTDSDGEAVEVEEGGDSGAEQIKLQEQGFKQGTEEQQFETIDHVTRAVVVRALAETKDTMQFQDVPGGQYQYHRGLEDDDTISSGIVRIPGLGTKPNKNAFASSVVYYVIQGTVQVTIYKSTMILHPGGRFLVPRGNQYMIKNLSRKESLLFFAQSKASLAQGISTLARQNRTTTAVTRATDQVRPD
ncbi:hypothetical protein BGX28_006551 [Mortierella sp. GBA30]|nr:hypothetical protein BGX28_006551 [Mortierella sp. GBA30]